MSDIENRLRATMRFGVLDGSAEERGILEVQIEEAIRELVRLRARAEAAERELVRLRAALEKAKGPIAIAASYADAPEVSLGLRVHARDCARILPEINAALREEAPRWE